MNTFTQYYFTLHFSFTAAIKEPASMESGECRLAQWGESVTTRPVFYSMFKQCTHSLK